MAFMILLSYFLTKKVDKSVDIVICCQHVLTLSFHLVLIALISKDPKLAESEKISQYYVIENFIGLVYVYNYFFVNCNYMMFMYILTPVHITCTLLIEVIYINSDKSREKNIIVSILSDSSVFGMVYGNFKNYQRSIELFIGQIKE